MNHQPLMKKSDVNVIILKEQNSSYKSWQSFQFSNMFLKLLRSFQRGPIGLFMSIGCKLKAVKLGGLKKKKTMLGEYETPTFTKQA